MREMYEMECEAMIDVCECEGSGLSVSRIGSVVDVNSLVCVVVGLGWLSSAVK